MNTPDERAFYSATNFHEAAIRCGEFVGEARHVVLEPRTVCLALAIELYLKSLVIRRVGKSHGHDLALLYSDQLDETERRIVASHYMRLRNASGSRMLRELTAVSKAFVQWRY